VADGRKQKGINQDRAHQLGRGRVYTGSQALALGLVDRLGTVADAVDEAARRGRVPTGPGGLPEMVLLPQAPSDPLETLLALRRLVTAAGAESELPAPGFDVGAFLARYGRAAARLLLPMSAGPSTGIEARLPYDLSFE
jgi:protease-4